MSNKLRFMSNAIEIASRNVVIGDVGNRSGSQTANNDFLIVIATLLLQLKPAIKLHYSKNKGRNLTRRSV